jgi:uncharacterized membrane protein
MSTERVNIGNAFAHLKPYWVLGAALMTGLLLRVYNIGQESIWWDEIVSVRRLSAATLFEFLRQVRADDPPMSPCYSPVKYFYAKAVGRSVVDLRLLRVFFSLATVVIVCFLARHLFGRVAAGISAFLVACSVRQINWGHLRYGETRFPGRPLALLRVPSQ